MASYDTNLAAEYHVLSCLHRLGLTAALTLGNKKGVDILVALDTGDALTIEVKGVAKKYDWPADNLADSSPKNPSRHYVVLVSFDGKIEKVAEAPRVWVIPFPELEQFVKRYATRTNIRQSQVGGKKGAPYEHAWRRIANAKSPQPPVPEKVLDLSTRPARQRVASRTR